MGAFLSGALGGGLGKKLGGMAKKAMSGGGKSSGGSYDQSGHDLSDSESGSPSSMKKGGTVKKTGLIKMHKGEKVLTKKQQKKMAKRMRGKQ